MIRTAIAFTLWLALAACATTSRSERQQAPSERQQATSVSHALMVDSALSMLGQPYRFGGAAPGGFDCSGLVEYAASGAGIRLPRTAREQLKSGEPVARGTLQAGDLIFLHLERKELHVGIAIDTERFVHAPSTGGYVRIDTLRALPYAKGFLGARRIILAP